LTAVAQAFDTSEREIIVHRLSKLRGGHTNGRGWVLYDVHADELDGSEIPVILRTFERLEGTTRVSFEPFMDKGAVSHYTLKSVRGADEIRASRSEARAAVMGEPAAPGRIGALEARIEALEGRFALLTSLLDKDRA
jgi:hypothetical protein